jgi:hypothetical protein
MNKHWSINRLKILIYLNDSANDETSENWKVESDHKYQQVKNVLAINNFGPKKDLEHSKVNFAECRSGSILSPIFFWQASENL